MYRAPRDAGCCLHRQLDPERRTLPRPLAGGIDASALELHQVTGDRQPEAEPAVRASDAGVRLAEALEHVGKKLGRNAGAGVADGDFDVRVHPLETDLDPAARGR